MPCWLTIAIRQFISLLVGKLPSIPEYALMRVGVAMKLPRLTFGKVQFVVSVRLRVKKSCSQSGSHVK